MHKVNKELARAWKRSAEKQVENDSLFIQARKLIKEVSALEQEIIALYGITEEELA